MTMGAIHATKRPVASLGTVRACSRCGIEVQRPGGRLAGQWTGLCRDCLYVLGSRSAWTPWLPERRGEDS